MAKTPKLKLLKAPKKPKGKGTVKAWEGFHSRLQKVLDTNTQREKIHNQKIADITKGAKKVEQIKKIAASLGAVPRRGKKK